MIYETNVKRFCCEDIRMIENYEQAVNDTTQIWDCHHRLEIQGQFTNSVKLLKRCGVYYHVPASQLIFLTHSEHSRLHASCSPSFLKSKRGKGKSLSEEARRKMSDAKKGKPKSEEHKKNISRALRLMHERKRELDKTNRTKTE